MPIFLIKTILSFVLLLLAFVAMYTMFEIFGRSAKRFNPTKLIRICLHFRIYPMVTYRISLRF